jgi:hypothetical protein
MRMIGLMLMLASSSIEKTAIQADSSGYSSG